MTNTNQIKNDIEKDNMLQIKVHPHIISGVSKHVDIKGTEHVIVSDLANMNQTEPKKQVISDFSSEKLLDSIYHLVAAIGMFSSRFVCQDEITKINYRGKEQEELRFEQLAGAATFELTYPHDRLQFHQDNQWIFRCYQIQYLTEKRMILQKHANFPSVLNIKRSSGAIQKGIIKPNEGFVVRIKKVYGVAVEPKQYQVRVKVHFSISDPECIDPLECDYNKFVYLDDLVEHNDDFTHLEIKNTLTEIDSIDTSEIIKKEVVDKIREDYQDWFHSEMKCALASIPNFKVSYL